MMIKINDNSDDDDNDDNDDDDIFFSFFFLFIALTDDPKVPVCGINETVECAFRELGRPAHKGLVVIKYHIYKYMKQVAYVETIRTRKSVLSQHDLRTLAPRYVGYTYNFRTSPVFHF